MSLSHQKEVLVIFIGDILFFVVALWLTLLIRYGDFPSWSLWLDHLIPFSFIFLVWLFVFFITDLYHQPTTIFQKKLPARILNAQLANSLIAVIFFYFLPFFAITPKTNLFIDLVISFILIWLWRRWWIKIIYPQKRIPVWFAATGAEAEQLKAELQINAAFGVKVLDSIDEHHLPPELVVVIDLETGAAKNQLNGYYRMIFYQVRFVPFQELYEEIFNRIPLSLIQDSWFIGKISNYQKSVYAIFKRAMDISIALVLGILSLLVYPLVYLAIKLDDGGTLFSRQQRIGQANQLITLLKFRTMTIANDGGVWGSSNQNQVTRVGRFLRRTRLDEWPQLWNVLAGKLSLIGPRPEFPEAVKIYSQAISYYPVRHLIKPGLSGWAQMYHDEHPHHGFDVAATRDKLSYDLYYLKNRDFWLDLKIALKTIVVLLSRQGV